MAYFKFTRAIAAGEPIEVFNEGRMERDFTYIDDIVDAIVRLIDKPPSRDPGFDATRPDPARAAACHRIFNIGNNAPVSLTRFIEAIEQALGREAQKRLLPMPPGDVLRTHADVADLAAAIGFSPNTSIEDGIGRFVAWYREFYGLPDGQGDQARAADSAARRTPALGGEP
jgi:UDP-glucuronate 4-epimerase